MARLFGKATIRLDGRELIKKQDGKLNLGGVQRHTVKGNEVYGFAEEAMEASIELNHFIGADTDLDALNNASDITGLFQCDSGQQYVLAHAWLESPVEIDEATDGGSTALKFVAPKAERVA